MPDDNFNAEKAKELTIKVIPEILANSSKRILAQVLDDSTEGFRKTAINFTDIEYVYRDTIIADLKNRKFRVKFEPDLAESRIVIFW